MKWIAWILLLANLAVAGFFIGRDYWPRETPHGMAPLNVDRLSLRSQSEAARKNTASQEVSSAEAAGLCVEWRGLGRDEFLPAREQLKAMAAERVMSFSEVPVNTRHWVIFPPLPSPQSAATKLSELKATGVEDAFVVADGTWRNAISLGLYANDQTARRRVSELEAAGVLGTHIELLPRKGTDFYFVIRSDDPDVLKDLSGLKQAYPNSQQSRVACPS
jgi:hypothetical protein